MGRWGQWMARICVAVAVLAGPGATVRAQTAQERCQQNACNGYGPPAGSCSGGFVFSDLSQTPAAQYVCKAGAWSAAGGGGGGGGITTVTGDVTAAGSGSVAATVQKVGSSTIGYSPSQYGSMGDPTSFETLISRDVANANVLALENLSNPNTNISGRADVAVAFRDWTGNEHAAIGFTTQKTANAFGTGTFWESSNLTGNAYPHRIVQTNSGVPRMVFEVSPASGFPQYGGLGQGINMYPHVAGTDVLGINAAMTGGGFGSAAIDFFNDTLGKVGAIGAGNSTSGAPFTTTQFFVSDSYDLFLHAGAGHIIKFSADSTYANSFAATIDATGVHTIAVQVQPTTAATCSSSIAGQIQYTQGNSTTKDVVQVCAHDASNAYAWRAIY